MNIPRMVADLLAGRIMKQLVKDAHEERILKDNLWVVKRILKEDYQKQLVIVYQERHPVAPAYVWYVSEQRI